MTNAVVDVGSEYDTVAICKYMNIVKGVEALPAVKTSFIFNRIYVLCVKKKKNNNSNDRYRRNGTSLHRASTP